MSLNIKGTFLISISGGINNAVNYDQIVITMQLKNASGVAINPTVVPTNPASSRPVYSQWIYNCWLLP